MNNLAAKGILPINKPQGWTSFDVVNKIKHMLPKKTKVGHLGTLDPMATGVLLVTIGKATKLFDIMQQKTKRYVATFKFGVETDSLDATGEIMKTDSKIVTLEQINAVLPKFVGKIEQIPPKFSAKSIGGKRAYDLARENVDFKLKPNKITVVSYRTISFNNNIWEVEILCGSGTYIRALGRDIANDIGTIATMTSLVRTEIDNFNLNQCVEISTLNAENLTENTIKIKDVLNLPTLKLSDEECFKILNGQSLNLPNKDGIYQLTDENDTIALIEICNFNAKMSIYLA